MDRLRLGRTACPAIRASSGDGFHTAAGCSRRSLGKDEAQERAGPGDYSGHQAGTAPFDVTSKDPVSWCQSRHMESIKFQSDICVNQSVGGKLKVLAKHGWSGSNVYGL